MSNETNYEFNISGDFLSAIQEMTKGVAALSKKMDEGKSKTEEYNQKLFLLKSLKEVFTGMANGIKVFSESGIELDSQMHDLSAVAGITGDELKQIEEYARQSAKAFGTDASTAVTGYKLLLSQLSPELAKTPEALQAMGDSIQTTAKLMGGDSVAAAEVLTTAMNQYGVSLDDPMQASEEMARMMNVMAAAGQAGSAELPAIKLALENCGMAAKAAGVSFEETNAAIQVLDKAGKKGAEGGVALRNVMGTLAKGRFLPKDVQDELKAAGVNINVLTDTTKPLKERLEAMKPVMNDTALLSKTFGVANANAAMALIDGTDALGDFTDKVSDTSSAYDQAAIVMDSYQERQNRINQQIEDFKISVFEATGDLALWTGTIMDTLTPLANFVPLLSLSWKGMKSLWVWTAKARASMLKFAKSVLTSKNRLKSLCQWTKRTASYLGSLAKRAWTATINIIKLSLAAIRNGVKAMINFAKSVWAGTIALGKQAIAFVTTGGLITFFGTVWTTVSGVISAGCRIISTAIYSIPLIGWIALAIAAIAAIGIYFWNTSVKFRAVLKGIWAAFKQVFTNIKNFVINIFSGIANFWKSLFTLDLSGMKAALKQLKDGAVNFATDVGSAFTQAYDQEIEESRKEEERKKKEAEAKKKKGEVDADALLAQFTTNEDDDVLLAEFNKGGKDGKKPSIPQPPVSPVGGTLGTVSNAGSESAGKIKNITVNVNKLVERLEVHTTTLTESTERVKEAISEALLNALNDVNLAVE